MRINTETPLDRGKADMRGRINVEGVERAALLTADAWAAPGNLDERDRLQGIILAAFEAGMLHQMNVGAK